MKGPSRATAVRGFVSVNPRYVIPCKVCDAHIGRPCRVIRGRNQGNILKKLHHPRTSLNYVHPEKPKAAPVKKKLLTEKPKARISKVAKLPTEKPVVKSKPKYEYVIPEKYRTISVEKKVTTEKPKPVVKAAKPIVKEKLKKYSFSVKVARAAVIPEPPKGWGGGYGTNSGHGHVWSRPDGIRLRCGGWRKCPECKDIKEYCIRFLDKVGI